MTVIDSSVVRNLLINRKMTVRDLAKRADGLAESTLANITRRDVRATYPVIGRLAEALGVKPEVFLKNSEPEQTFRFNREREIEDLTAMREELSEKYPHDKKRLQTLDALIDANRAALDFAVEVG